MQIRPAAESDLPDVSDLYGHQARHGIATFDTEPRSLAWWRERWAGLGTGDHLVVVEDGGRVVGYAASGYYRPRPAYDLTRETSVYVDPGTQGRGLGRALYTHLLDLLHADGMHRVVTVVALPNDPSRALHLACGFESVGVLREVGRKFDRWIDTELFQLALR